VFSSPKEPFSKVNDTKGRAFFWVFFFLFFLDSSTQPTRLENDEKEIQVNINQTLMLIF
jgi:hypothetical protein